MGSLIAPGQSRLIMDVPHEPGPRLDRGHHRQHVQRQERGAHPPAAARADRAAEGADLQAGDRQPVRRSRHRVAQRDADSAASTSAPRRELLRLVDDETEVVGIDEAQFFDKDLLAVCNAAGRQRQAGDRGGAGYRTISAGRSSRCRQLLAIAEYITKTLRHLHGVRQPGQPHATARGQRRAAVGRRHRHVRGALPQVLRSESGRVIPAEARREIARGCGHGR